MVEKKEQIQEKKVEKDIWEIGEIATQTQPVLVNTATGEQLDMLMAQQKILNYLERLMQLLK